MAPRKPKKPAEAPTPTEYAPAPARPIPPGLARFRVPDSASPEAAAICDRALQRIEDVLEERVHPSVAPAVLKAAQMYRDEVCGPLPKEINVKGLTLNELILKATAPAEEEPEE